MSKTDEIVEQPAPAIVSRQRRVAVAFTCLVLAVCVPLVKPYSAQGASRMSLTAAIVDGGTIYIDDYRRVTAPIDRIDTGDRLLSDKAPGQPIAAVPFYALSRLVGAEPVDQLRIDRNLTTWWITVWFSMVPLAAVAVLAYDRARRFAPRAALPATLSLTFGSMLLPFGTELYGHVLTSALAFASWTVGAPLGDDRPTARRLMASGALMGAAVAVEYPTAIVAAVLLLAFTVEYRRRIGWWILGGVPFAAAIAAYQWAAFGRPWTTSYQTKSGSEIYDRVPGLDVLLQTLFGQRGLLLLSPVLILGVVGLVLGWRLGGTMRREVAVAAAVCLGFLALQASWSNPWGGEGPGPRYIIPLLPFFCVPIAGAWSRAPRVATIASLIGVAMASLAALTMNLIPHGAGYVDALLTNLERHGWTPTLFTMALGPAGWLVHLALVAAAGTWLWRAADAAAHETSDDLA